MTQAWVTRHWVEPMEQSLPCALIAPTKIETHVCVLFVVCLVVVLLCCVLFVLALVVGPLGGLGVAHCPDPAQFATIDAPLPRRQD